MATSYTPRDWENRPSKRTPISAENLNAMDDQILSLTSDKLDIKESQSLTSAQKAIAKTNLGLNNVNNTADLDKPISTATQAALNNKIESSLIGANNGVASLDGTGRIPYSQLPESAMEYKGVWDASTNTPVISANVGDHGDFYIVSVSGVWNNITFNVNDRIIYDKVLGWCKLVGTTIVTWSGISDKPSAFPPSSHTHVKADITDFPTLGTAAAKNTTDSYDANGTDPITGKGVAQAITGVTSSLGTAASKNTTDTYDANGTDPITGKGVSQAIASATAGVSSFNGRNGAVEPLAGDYTWSDISGKPSTFAPSSHTQSASTITAGTFPDQVVAAATTAYTTAKVVNMVSVDVDPGDNASVSYPNGTWIGVHE